jgi:alpha-glucosidase
MDEYLWWRDGVIYQIYPRSFLDTNADGFGDLPGITSRLDYLADLGVAALWLSPIYPSPDADFGYDVADHTAIDPRYGTLADFDMLVEEAHRRGLRIILDAVLNHTSDQHPWFLESRSSRDNPKRDWYTWRPAPNNWISMFGGSAWEYDQVTGEYYYHMFAREQPDLNFNNPQVRQAQLDLLRFWLERGVDGFRLDVFNATFEHPELPDNPRSPLGRLGLPLQKHLQDADQPALIPFLGELRALVDGYPGRYLVGETLGGPATAARYVGDQMLHAAFSFDFTDSRWSFPFSPGYFMERAVRRESLFGAQGWPTNVFSNHDVPRAASRYARTDDDDGRARLAMALLLTLRGTPFMYQGEEIAMRDVRLGRREIMDPAGKPCWPFYKGRDGPRSPFQWSAAPNAGFSAGAPWLKVHPDYRSRNLTAQKADPRSFFYFTHRLIALRQIHPALQQGDFVPLAATREVLAYQRKTEHETLTVLLNFARKPTPLRLPPNAPHLPHGGASRGGEKGEARILYSTDCAEGVITGPIVLAPQEVCIIG